MGSHKGKENLLPSSLKRNNVNKKESPNKKFKPRMKHSKCKNQCTLCHRDEENFKCLEEIEETLNHHDELLSSVKEYI